MCCFTCTKSNRNTHTMYSNLFESSHESYYWYQCCSLDSLGQICVERRPTFQVRTPCDLKQVRRMIDNHVYSKGVSSDQPYMDQWLNHVQYTQMFHTVCEPFWTCESFWFGYHPTHVNPLGSPRRSYVIVRSFQRVSGERLDHRNWNTFWGWEFWTLEVSAAAGLTCENSITYTDYRWQSDSDGHVSS